MKRKVLYSMPLRFVVPGIVLLVFGLLAVLLLISEERQWGDYFERTTAATLRNDMAHLRDALNDAPPVGDRAERIVSASGFGEGREVLAAIRNDGRVLYAAHHARRGAVASTLPGYSAALAAGVVAQGRPLVRFSADHNFIVAYYPLNASIASRGMQPGDVLYARVDLASGHARVRYMAFKASALLWVATALAMLLLYVMLRSFVVRPLEMMAEAAGAIVRGEAEPFTIRGRGHISQLGHAFNQAAVTARQLLTELRESERRYRTIVEHVGLGIVLIDHRFHLLESNGTARAWFPQADEAEHCYNLFSGPGGTRCTFCSAHTAFAAGRVVETGTTAMIGGEERILRIVMTPVKDEQGNVQACVNFMEDITEREATRQELEKVARALRALSVCGSAVLRARTGQELLQQVCDVVVSVGGYSMCWIGRAADDARRSVVPVATAGGAKGYLSRITVTWADDELGRGPAGTAIREQRSVAAQDILNAPEYEPWREAALEHGFRAAAAIPLFLEGRPYGAFTVYAAERGAFVPEELALLIELAETTMHGVQSLYDQQARRVSERELTRINSELEQRVEQRTAELNRINRELEAFTYSVSHDLRAPLRAIDGFSQILVQRYAEVLDAQAADYLQRVRRATQRMGRLIDDLLGLARINRYDLRMEPVDLSAVARELCRELQDADPARRVEVAVEPGLRAQTDSRLVRIILANLLGNAWKYTGKRPDARIELSRWEDDYGNGFVVRDNGVGFDMKYAGKLFAPFQRLHGTDEFEGTGIGLATVQRAIERLHGYVLAEARPGTGAAFFFCFDCHAPRETRDRGTT